MRIQVVWVAAGDPYKLLYLRLPFGQCLVRVDLIQAFAEHVVF